MSIDMTICYTFSSVRWGGSSILGSSYSTPWNTRLLRHDFSISHTLSYRIKRFYITLHFSKFKMLILIVNNISFSFISIIQPAHRHKHPLIQIIFHLCVQHSGETSLIYVPRQPTKFGLMI